MKLETIFKNIAVREWQGSSDVEISSIAYHSNRVQKGSLFCVWKGEKTDGYSYIPQAIEKGAAALLVEKPIENVSCPVVVVDNARSALTQAAAQFFQQPSQKLRMVGITGTNGKTSTAFLVHDFVQRAGMKAGLIGTVVYDLGKGVIEAERTTPEGLDVQTYLHSMVENGCRAAVMETTSHALRQGRVDGISFEVGIFTNLTQDHLDYHGTMESYFEAKQLLFTRLQKNQSAVLNIDDSYGKRLINLVSPEARVFTYGINASNANFRAEQIDYTAQGTNFVLQSPEGTFNVKARWIGMFNISNILAALAAGYALGLKVADMVQRLATQPFVPGRMEVMPHTKDFAVVVDYAHTDDALRKAIQTLRPLTKGSLWVLAGCGGNRDKTKRPLMAQAACELGDRVIFTSDNPRNESPEAILDDMTEGVRSFRNYQTIVDRAEAIQTALCQAQKGDVVLIAGKGHEITQEIQGVKHPFSDRDVALRFIEGGKA